MHTADIDEVKSATEIEKDDCIQFHETSTINKYGKHRPAQIQMSLSSSTSNLGTTIAINVTGSDWWYINHDPKYFRFFAVFMNECSLHSESAVSASSNVPIFISYTEIVTIDRFDQTARCIIDVRAWISSFILQNLWTNNFAINSTIAA